MIALVSVQKIANGFVVTPIAGPGQPPRPEDIKAVFGFDTIDLANSLSEAFGIKKPNEIASVSKLEK